MTNFLFTVTGFTTEEGLLNSYKSSEENVLGAIVFYKIEETIEVRTVDVFK